MSSMRQGVLGVLAALFSAFIIFGSMLLALSEGGRFLALALTPTITNTPLPPVDTPLPGEPTFTPSPTPLPSPTFTPPVSENCPKPPGWQTVDILPGDTLPQIAAAYSITLEELAARNCLNGDETLLPGNFLYVPAATQTPTVTPPPPTSSPTATRPTATRRPTRVCSPPAGWIIYVVKRNDTLYAISSAYGITVPQLQAANCISTIIIHPGDRLYVPNVATRTPVPSATPRPTNTPRPSVTTPPTTVAPPTTAPPTTPAPTTPSDTPVPPSDTPVPPSDTPVPPSSTPTDPPTSTPLPPTLVPPTPSATSEVDT